MNKNVRMKGHVLERMPKQDLTFFYIFLIKKLTRRNECKPYHLDGITETPLAIGQEDREEVQ